ncbi:MAG: hypothetical protein P8M25_08255 [Paracoccaceae bacterium]|nr:hypothetical protein [Paracoccaceae bacterium]
MATKATPRIAKIARIDDDAKHATDLFVSLKDLGDTPTTQYNTLLSTRLIRTPIGDFQFDDLTRVMRLMPFEEDLRRLRDPVQLARFLEDAEDLRDGIRTLCKALNTSGGNMQREDIIPYFEGVIKEMDHAKESDLLRTAKVIGYRGVLENFSLDAATRAELGEPLSKALSQQVNNILDLTRSHFADTFLRLAPLHDIEMAPSQTPAQALGQIETLLRDTRAVAQHNLVPLVPKDDAIFTHMMWSIERLTRAHRQATSDSDRASYQREINCHLAIITVSLKLYINKGRHHMGNLRSIIDVVLQQVKQAKNLQEIIDMAKKNLDYPPT